MEKLNTLQLNKYNSVGAIHIHSVYSDGTGNIESISKAAKNAGLDWIIVTDHNSFEIEEGIYNGVYVIKGEEISPKGENHYLALGINKYIQPNKNAKHNIEAVKLNGGFGFAAHPNEGVNSKGQMRLNKHQPIKWTNKNIIPDGVEIWNWFSEWADNLNDKNIFTLAYAFLCKNKLVKSANSNSLSWWDDLNNELEDIVPAIGGIDAHALKIKDYIIPVTIFPYESMFKTIVNIVTSDEEFKTDFFAKKEQILEALKSGRNLIINRAVSKEIPVINVSNRNQAVTSGESINLDNETLLNVQTKKKGSIKIFHNGKEIKSVISNSIKMLLNEVCKYRVEIKFGERGFAYSNPIMVY